MASQRFSPYSERISRELEDFDVRVSGLKGLTAMLSKDEDARLIAHVALRHDQELGSFLDDHRPFDLLPIMRRRTSWSCEWLLFWCIHSIQALQFEIKSEWFRHTRELPRSCEVGVRWCKVRQHLYWTDDIWCFLEAMDTPEFRHCGTC